MKKHPTHDVMVSVDGRVFSMGGKEKKLSVNDAGYLVTSVGGRGVPLRRVHHLVLETYVGFRADGQECRHLDGVPTNNRLDNLKWGTREEQIADQKAHGTFSPPPIHAGFDNPGAKYDQSKIDKVYELRDKGMTTWAIAKATCVSKTQVCRYLQRR